MQRRALLKGIVRGIPVAAGAAAGAAMHSATAARELADPAVQGIKDQLEALSSRLDRNDARTKKLLRVALVAASLSLGLDLTALL